MIGRAAGDTTASDAGTSARPATPPGARLAWLDALRGLAALAVVAQILFAKRINPQLLAGT